MGGGLDQQGSETHPRYVQYTLQAFAEGSSLQWPTQSNKAKDWKYRTIRCFSGGPRQFNWSDWHVASVRSHFRWRFSDWSTQLVDQSTGPLNWWIKQKNAGNTHGGLSQMALDVLSCPATSVDVERAFSFGRHYVNQSWHRLNSVSITRGMSVAFYSKNNLIETGDLKKWKEGLKEERKKREKVSCEQQMVTLEFTVLDLLLSFILLCFHLMMFLFLYIVYD